MASYMVKIEKSEDVASLVDRAINAAVDAQAEYVYFDLMQHFLIIRVRRSSRMRTLWRGPRTPEAMAHLKVKSGMDVLECRVVQRGEYPFLYQDRIVGLSTTCDGDGIHERAVLALTACSLDSKQ